MQTEQLDSITSKTNQKGNTWAVGVFTGLLRQKMSTFIQNYKEIFK